MPGGDVNVVRSGSLRWKTRWMTEPLVIFGLIGALIFAANAWFSEPEVSFSDRQIVLTTDDLTQMAAGLRLQGLENLTPAQFQNLLDARIREEVIYREALAMGLERNDTIIKRRLVQKMDFLAEDLSDLREPTEEELMQWLTDHPQDFEFPPRASFRHIYFSYDEHAEQAQRVAEEALTSVENVAIDAPEVTTLGDPFMFQDYYAERTPEQIGLEFGGMFAMALFNLEPGHWVGPIESGFGWHLVFIDNLVPAVTPEFEAVANEVKSEWMANQRREFKEAAYEAMRSKYEVILPEALTAPQVSTEPGPLAEPEPAQVIDD
ncbi:MAG: peptidylprolyl isomerase [Lysobacterales bacterium]